MLALFGNLDFMELVVIAAAALMIFGKRLPEVAMRGAAQAMRLRRTVTQMWREAGIEDELRRVQREIDSVPRIPTPQQLVREADRRRRTLDVRVEPPSDETLQKAPEEKRSDQDPASDRDTTSDGSHHNAHYERFWPSSSGAAPPAPPGSAPYKSVTDAVPEELEPPTLRPEPAEDGQSPEKETA